MESKILAIILIIILFLSSIFVIGAGCQQKTSASASAEDLDTEFNDLENMNQELNDLEMNISGSDLENLEGII